MPRLLLFDRLLVRPLILEPIRSALTVLAVALGVAVVLAIDLAGGAATGSFRSSMETLGGDSELEVVAAGGVPENVIGSLAQLPYNLRISPRVEDFAIFADTKESVPLLGIDLIGESKYYSQKMNAAFSGNLEHWQSDSLPNNLTADSVWVASGFNCKPGEHLSLIINDRERD